MRFGSGNTAFLFLLGGGGIGGSATLRRHPLTGFVSLQPLLRKELRRLHGRLRTISDVLAAKGKTDQVDRVGGNRRRQSNSSRLYDTRGLQY
jgi:hypothetical protein